MELWAARDEDGKLYIYSIKPRRATKFWAADIDDGELFMEVDGKMLPNLKWESEPIQVEVTFKAKEL